MRGHVACKRKKYT